MLSCGKPVPPVRYGYGAQGRMEAMYTLRDPAVQIASHQDFLDNEEQFDRTAWVNGVGLMTNKVYADGKGTACDYAQDGKLAERNWARGDTTAYQYDEVSGPTFEDRKGGSA